MIRKIIQIDEDLCNGCGICVNACHEGAIGLVDGKAQLLRDDYCDGLGDCLPACPTGAITFVEREAAAYDKAACPGTLAKTLREADSIPTPTLKKEPVSEPMTQLRQWPVQIKLLPITAPYFHQANLLIAADCAAFAYGDFHNRFMKNKITLIGCPKFDGDYSEKLTAILANNEIKSLTVVRMEVPCCGGLQSAAIRALQNSGKMIPWQVITLSADGKILD